MATIKITDALGVELISANPPLNSGFGKYLKGLPAQLLAGADVAARFKQDLGTVNPGPSGFSLNFKDNVPLGGTDVNLRIGGSAKATIGVYNRAGMPLFDDNFIGAPLKVAGGQAFLSFAFNPVVNAGVTPKVGDISFGIDAGAEAEFRCYRPFDLIAAPKTLGAACQELFEHFAIPASIADLRTMGDLPAGTLASVSGSGHLNLGASVELTAAFNPLATINSIPKLGKLTVSGASSVTAGIKVKISGDFQVRVQTTAPKIIRLSYHKMHGTEIDLDFQAAAGPSVTLGDKDLLKLLFGGGAGASDTDEQDLVAAGISPAQLAAITDAMRKGMSRKINLELAAQFSSLRKDEAAFEYEIDLNTLDAAGESAVNKALGGDLSDLNALERAMPAHGVRVLQSRFDALRRRQIRWRINLLGIVNVLSMTEFAKKGSVFHDEESGELVIADEASVKRIGATISSKKLRKVLYESAMITVAYKASGADVNTEWKAAQSFFLLEQRANRQTVSDFLDAIAAVGLMKASDIGTTLGGVDEFGKSSLLLETEYGQDACLRLFQDGGGAPRTTSFYEGIGKLAVLGLVEQGDPDSYRRLPMEDGDLWDAMKEGGAFSNVVAVLPSSITNRTDGALRSNAVFRDLILITWWAEAMSAAASKLADVIEAIKNHNRSGPLDTDAVFQDARKALADALGSAIGKNKSNFDEPWGLVAMFLASQRTATASATVVSPKLTLVLP